MNLNYCTLYVDQESSRMLVIQNTEAYVLTPEDIDNIVYTPAKIYIKSEEFILLESLLC